MNSNDETAVQYQKSRITNWDNVAKKRDAWQGWGKFYHHRMQEIYRFLTSPGQRVLEVGCGRGDLLAFLQPERGVGVDFSPEMIQRARAGHAALDALEFIEADVHDLSSIHGPFDVIILSDLVNDLWDVQCVLEQVRSLCDSHTRLILNFYNGFWQFPLNVAQRLNLAVPMLDQNWLTREDVSNMLNLAGFDVVRQSHEILWPFPLGDLANKFLVRLWPFRDLALSTFIIARPRPEKNSEGPSVSIIVP
ncbi:MAG TPA: methyltransferase domain-containing protein, partial [Anaerolineales bacterium]